MAGEEERLTWAEVSATPNVVAMNWKGRTMAGESSVEGLGRTCPGALMEGWGATVNELSSMMVN